MPTVSASGTALNTSSAPRGTERRTEQEEDQEEAGGYHDRKALAPRAAVLELPAPGDPTVGRELHPALPPWPAPPRPACRCHARARSPSPRPGACRSCARSGSGLPRSEARHLLQQDGGRAPAAFHPLQGTGRCFRASMSLRTASGSRTTIGKRWSPSNRTPAFAAPMAAPITSWTAARLRPQAGDPGLLHIDFEERQA